MRSTFLPAGCEPASHPPASATLTRAARLRLALPGLAVLVLLLLGAAPGALAATCSISAPTMNIGSYTGAVSNAGTTTLTVTCPSGTAYNLLMGFGNGSGATTYVHYMTSSSSAKLQYGLFQNSARTANWGQQTGTDTVSGTGTGSAQTYSIYPQTPSGQLVAAGTYTDTMSITVSSFLGSTQTSFSVTATVTANCTLSASALAFGTYASASIKTATSTLSATCTNATTYNVGLNAGTTSGATVTTRAMVGQTSTKLLYHVYSDSGRTTEWGNTVGTNTVTGTGTGAAQTLTTYGSIAAGQTVDPGSYTDTITATITY